MLVFATVNASRLASAEFTYMTYPETREANFNLWDIGNNFVSNFEDRDITGKLLAHKFDANGFRRNELERIAVPYLPIQAAHLSDFYWGLNKRQAVVQVKILRHPADDAVTERPVKRNKRSQVLEGEGAVIQEAVCGSIDRKSVV